MIPNGGNIDESILSSEANNEKTLTFGINIEENIFGGMVDGLDALRQNIYFMLNTEADQYIIYPYTYGIGTLELIGKPSYYVTAVLPKRIKGTLMTDDRILDVTDMTFQVDKSKIHVKFVVKTIYGNLDAETEVSY